MYQPGNISLSAFAPENLVSRDGFGSRPALRQPGHLQTQAESASSAAAFIKFYLFETTIRHRVNLAKKKKVPGQGFGSLITRAEHAIIETVVLRVGGWFVGCLFFCVDVIDGAQQCSVLQ